MNADYVDYTDVDVVAHAWDGGDRMLSVKSGHLRKSAVLTISSEI
jgi:hypothetical protein